MSKTGRERIVKLILDMREDETIEAVKKLLAEGADPLKLLDWLNEGMRKVGERFESGRYYMASLIMAGEIMREACELLSPHLDQAKPPGRVKGRLLLATVQGDIHDLGKNIFSQLLQCKGFAVDDLGVDVPASAIVERAKASPPDLIGLSCTLTSGLEDLKATVAEIKRALGEWPKVIIGGAVVDANVNAYVGADLWAPDAAEGVKICAAEVKEGRGVRRA